tara:strand:+ start:296 stop:481 length:186 start_codon:yes stop_codon:yes gene_type:complete
MVVKVWALEEVSRSKLDLSSIAKVKPFVPGVPYAPGLIFHIPEVASKEPNCVGAKAKPSTN